VDANEVGQHRNPGPGPTPAAQAHDGAGQARNQYPSYHADKGRLAQVAAGQRRRAVAVTQPQPHQHGEGQPWGQEQIDQVQRLGQHGKALAVTFSEGGSCR
jgi:hypothetical protein